MVGWIKAALLVISLWLAGRVLWQMRHEWPGAPVYDGGVDAAMEAVNIGVVASTFPPAKVYLAPKEFVVAEPGVSAAMVKESTIVPDDDATWAHLDEVMARDGAVAIADFPVYYRQQLVGADADADGMISYEEFEELHSSLSPA